LLYLQNTFFKLTNKMIDEIQGVTLDVERGWMVPA
jgi:hypothetical protein